MTATRAEIYAAIDRERDYQDGWKDPTLTTSGGTHSVQEYLTYMRSYVNEALEIGARRPDPAAIDAALHCIRKVAALAVVTMEEHGVRERNPQDNLRARHP
jgi:hypothetical protein